VIDYKDGWTVDEHIQKYWTKLHTGLANKLEKKALKRATVLIGVTDGLIKSYRCSYPRESQDKWCLITHGFDAQDFKPSLKPLRDWSPPLKIVYAATHLNGISYSMDKFLEAIKLVNRGNRKVHLTCIGRPNGADAYAGILGLTDKDVTFLGPQPKQFVIRAYQDADILVMILNSTEWNKEKYTSKLFDLLGAQRPILACVPEEGKAGDLIRKLGVGKIVENEKPREIADKIEVFLKEFAARKVKTQYNLGPKYKFERQNIVAQLESRLIRAARN
jgi:glycosyltransferase involved in cell wall biosynthesis